MTKLLQVNSTGPLTWVDFSYTMQNTITDPGNTCHLSETGTSTTPGQLGAVATPMLGSLNAFEGSPTPPPVPVMASVSVVGGSAPTETYQHTSCDGSTTTSTDSRWSWAYDDIGKHWATDPGQQAEDFIDSKTFTLSDGSAGQLDPGGDDRGGVAQAASLSRAPPLAAAPVSRTWAAPASASRRS